MNMGWAERVFSFTATDRTTMIALATQNAGAFGPAIDNNVRITRLSGNESLSKAVRSRRRLMLPRHCGAHRKELSLQPVVSWSG